VPAVLAVVGEAVAVAIALRVVLLRAEVELALPAVGELVVVALAGERRGGAQGDDRDQEGERHQDAVKAGQTECIGTPRLASRVRVSSRTNGG